MTATPALQEYFQEAESWDADRVGRIRRSAKLAWWVAGAGWLCSMASVLALAMLSPLKQVEPFVIRVDNTTGIVDVVPVAAGASTPEQAVTR